jgi:hypothetical protein
MRENQLSQLIILILQTINIMCKFQILQSMQFTGRARCRNWFFQLSLKRNSVSIHLINFFMQNRVISATPSKTGLDLSSATSTLSISSSSHLEACFFLKKARSARKIEQRCGSRTGGWSLPGVMSD